MIQSVYLYVISGGGVPSYFARAVCGAGLVGWSEVGPNLSNRKKWSMVLSVPLRLPLVCWVRVYSYLQTIVECWFSFPSSLHL